MVQYSGVAIIATLYHAEVPKNHRLLFYVLSKAYWGWVERLRHPVVYRIDSSVTRRSGPQKGTGKRRVTSLRIGENSFLFHWEGDV